MMDDLISRQAAIDTIEGITSTMSVCVNSDECHGMKRMQRQAVLEIANMPSAQQERKTGRWIDESVVTGTTTGGTTLIRQYRCSVCGGLFGRHTDNYCYNCGAKMETEQ